MKLTCSVKVGQHLTTSSNLFRIQSVTKVQKLEIVKGECSHASNVVKREPLASLEHHFFPENIDILVCPGLLYSLLPNINVFPPEAIAYDTSKSGFAVAGKRVHMAQNVLNHSIVLFSFILRCVALESFQGVRNPFDEKSNIFFVLLVVYDHDCAAVP
jgi:hypothetical protein